MSTGEKGVFIICSDETREKLEQMAPSKGEKELFLKLSVSAYSAIYKKIDRNKMGLISDLAGRLYANFLHKKGHDL